jgi:TolA-binding protein
MRCFFRLLAVVGWWAAAAGMAAGAAPPPKPPPKPPDLRSGFRLLPGHPALLYLLHVPRGYDAARKYPLLVVAPASEGEAVPCFKRWQGQVGRDGIFLAVLECPPGAPEDQAARHTQLVERLLRQYAGIDRARMVFLGVRTGAAQVVEYVVAHPRVFAAGVALDLQSLGDLTRVASSARPRWTPAATRLLVTLDPKTSKAAAPLEEARKYLERLGIAVQVTAAESQGTGAQSEADTARALEAVRGLYEPAHRAEVAARLAAEAQAAQKRREEAEAKRAQEAKAKEAAAAAAKPDELLVAGETAYHERDYARALDSFRALVRLLPGSDYARVAQKRIDELEADPVVQRHIAESKVAPEAQRLLKLARAHRRVGDKVKATLCYRQVIEKFPGTFFAEDAQQELDDLGP